MGEPRVGAVLPNGVTMGERAAALLSSVCCEVVLVGSLELLPPPLRSLPLLPDRWKESGPLGGLEALLASGRDTEYLAIPCDLPLLSPSLLRLLVSGAGTAPAVFRLEGAERPEPFPLLLSAGAHPKLALDPEAGRLSARAFVESLFPRIVEVPAGEEACFRNVNTPEQIRDPSLAERLASEERNSQGEEA